MRPVRIVIPSNAPSQVIPLDWRGQVSVPTLQIGTVAGAILVALQYTLDDVFSPTFNPVTAQWHNVANAGNVVAAGTWPLLDAPTGSPITATAVRAVNTDVGTAILTVVSSNNPGA